mmetsp:Transcript_20345/g.52777  ORF Transcript_20345/g.52777 Transcript_20345/m.52777 type:complete len:481 (+) Transcript_20345:190-1632(+)
MAGWHSGEGGLNWPSPGCISVFDLDNDRAEGLADEVKECCALASRATRSRGMVEPDGPRGEPQPCIIQRLDASYGGSLTSLGWLDHPVWHQLESLVLDNNSLTTMSGCPRLKGLRTLSLNLNGFADIDNLMEVLAWAFEDLTYLSLLGNPCCPAELTGGNDRAYSMYCRLVTRRLPQLKYLDTIPVDVMSTSAAKPAPRTLTGSSRGSLRSALVQSASKLLGGIGCKQAPRRSSIGSQVIRKRTDECPIEVATAPALDSDRPIPAAPLDVAYRKRERLEISQAEYDHIAKVVAQIEMAEGEGELTPCDTATTTATNSRRGSGGDGGRGRGSPVGVDSPPQPATFGALVSALEAEQQRSAGRRRRLSMKEERALALALDKADTLLAEELAELETQARIVRIEQRERVFGLRDPSEHGGVDGTEDPSTEGFSAGDRYSKAMERNGYRHVDATRTTRRLTHDLLPPALDLSGWSPGAVGAAAH